MMNNLTEGTEFRRKIEEFQRVRKLGSKALVVGEVGRGWWRGFLRRDGHRIATKRGERFATERSEWTTLANIDQMYDIIYNEMVEAKIAKRLEESDKVYNDIYGNLVTKENRFGKNRHSTYSSRKFHLCR